MWIGIAIAAVVVPTLALLLWLRKPQVADDMRQWQHDLDVLGRTASRRPVGGAAPVPAEPEQIGDTVRVLHGRTGDDD